MRAERGGARRAGQVAAARRGRAAALALLAGAAALALIAAFPARALPGEGDAGETLARSLERIFAAKDLAGAEVGVSVVDVASGRALFERGAARPLSLASNTKLVTTAAALSLLGPGHRFETTLSRRGPIVGDTLHGDLVVTGGGDPCLGARFDGEADQALRRLGRSLREAGVRRVSGALIGDDRLFDRAHQHPDWPRDQLDRWYAAPVSALTLNDACVDITVGPGPRAGVPAVVSLAPSCALFELELRCGTTAERKAHVVDVGRRPGANRYVVRGDVLVGSAPVETSIAVHDPSLVFVSVLRERLADEGVRVEGPARVVAVDERLQGLVPLAVHASLLAQALPVVNKRSQNHVAELLLKGLGAAKGGAGTWEAGIAVEKEWLDSIGVDPESVSLLDGSGLARGNRLSAGALATLLRAMARHEHAGAFLASLAVAGQDGTLEKRLRAPALKGRVLAKTGTINAVSSLSGYVLAAAREGAPPGPPVIAFSILMNGVKGGAARAREAQDRAVLAIFASLGGAAEAEVPPEAAGGPEPGSPPAPSEDAPERPEEGGPALRGHGGAR
jgi:D-alanyl-D-alanine carboxypeptidase/D-alanyl-D-alanine-endopeptidase (penicillin-binding protein 4)